MLRHHCYKYTLPVPQINHWLSWRKIPFINSLLLNRKPCFCVSFSTLPARGSSADMHSQIDIYIARPRQKSRPVVEINPCREKEWWEFPKRQARYPSTSNGHYCKSEVKKYVIIFYFTEAVSKFNYASLWKIMDVKWLHCRYIKTKATGSCGRVGWKQRLRISIRSPRQIGCNKSASIKIPFYVEFFHYAWLKLTADLMTKS